MSNKPVAELIAVPGKSFPALVFADGFRDLPAGTKFYADFEPIPPMRHSSVVIESDFSVRVVFPSCRLASEFERWAKSVLTEIEK
jgi:hypothetical protein